MIQILENERTFHLQTTASSLILHVMESGHPVCLYWGGKVDGDSFSYIVKEIKKASYLSGTDGNQAFRLEQYPLLYPAYGNPDMRTPAFLFRYEDGSRITDLRFQGYEVFHGSRKLDGYPTCMDKEAEGIVVKLSDRAGQAEVWLTYTVFQDYDAVTQSAKVFNPAKTSMVVEKLMSGCISFLDDRYDCLTLTGAWGRERHVNREAIRQGLFVLDSKRGASGHGSNPFVALVEPGADEDNGNVYAMNLVYSGSFEADIEVDMHQNTRMMMGINSFDFAWKLDGGACFQSPELVLVHSSEGLGGMSRSFHRFYRECLMPKRFAHSCRPVLINNWEATYFSFDRKTILALADEAVRLGVELFVLDDGWFGHRDREDSSLGDWTAYEAKLGGTLESLAEEIHARGLQFGLWFEPEMVSPDSHLYRSHPDWIIRVPGHEPQSGRNQYVLDLGRKEVQDYIIDSLDRVLGSAGITYVKWDMNRNITDIGSAVLPADRQKEVLHRYMLGLYRILEEITGRYPDVLFEGCAGGGGRFDPGMLCYFSQIWTSDDTDAMERLEIQRGTSMAYPGIAMGCHVSACPNHQMGRVTSLHTRGVVAMGGNLGYELNLLELGETEKQEIREQIAFYKHIRDTVQNGILYRLKSDGQEYAWMYLAEDGSQAVVSHVRVLARGNTVPKRLKLAGLSRDSWYEVTVAGEKVGNSDKSRILSGSSLCSIGLPLSVPEGDFFAEQWIVEKLHK